MYAIVLLSILAAASAAPHYHHGPPPFHPDHHPEFGLGRPPFNDDIFDTRRFWADLATEMRQLDDMLEDFYKKFPSIISTQGIEGNEYKITIPLSGFDEKDIIVKAREGLLMVQAVHNLPEGGQRSYLDIKTLPTYINVTGNWIFENNVLKVTFPLKPDAPSGTEAPVTEAPQLEDRSREEMDNHSADDNDADVFANRGDKVSLTNEISKNSVEATTYAVDLKDEVEFVPVRY